MSGSNIQGFSNAMIICPYSSLRATSLAKCYKTIFTSTWKSMSTDPASDLIETHHRGEYYKKIGTQDVTSEAHVKPVGWDESLPFQEIPGPKPLPILGNFWRFIPPFGEYANVTTDVLFKRLFDKYGKIVVLEGIGRPRTILLKDPEHFETIYRNDGAWPIRETVPSFVYYRKVTRNHLFDHFSGVATVHGEKWFKFRSMLNPIFMQPRVVAVKVPEINDVAQDLVKDINHLIDRHQDGIMPDDFMMEIQRWALETMGALALDTRLGCLELNSPDPSVNEIIDRVSEFFDLMYKLDIEPSLWRYVSTPTWRRFVKVLDKLTSDNMKYIDVAVEKLKNKSSNKLENEQSVLERLIEIDRKAAIIMSLDMMVAGIDTTGKTLASILYLLSKNPEAQNKLRHECMSNLPNKDSAITAKILEKSPYVKATVKEGLRVAPTAAGNLRTTKKDLVLGGYQVPKGTHIMMYNGFACADEKYFKNAKEFVPERWLRSNNDEFSHKNAHPFAYLPFGYGPRTCIGKRFASIELEIAVAKIVRNFKISWPHRDNAKFEQKLLFGISSPLNLKFEPVNQ